MSPVINVAIDSSDDSPIAYLTVGCQAYKFESREAAQIAANAVSYAIQVTLSHASHSVAAIANDLSWKAMEATCHR